MKTEKGHQGFIKKYNSLGKTTHIRVPISIASKIKNTVELLEEYASNNGIERVNKFIDNLNSALEKM